MLDVAESRLFCRLLASWALAWARMAKLMKGRIRLIVQEGGLACLKRGAAEVRAADLNTNVHKEICACVRREDQPESR